MGQPLGLAGHQQPAAVDHRAGQRALLRRQPGLRHRRQPLRLDLDGGDDEGGVDVPVLKESLAP